MKKIIRFITLFFIVSITYPTYAAEEKNKKYETNLLIAPFESIQEFSKYFETQIPKDGHFIVYLECSAFYAATRPVFENWGVNDFLEKAVYFFKSGEALVPEIDIMPIVKELTNRYSEHMDKYENENPDEKDYIHKRMRLAKSICDGIHELREQ